MLFLTLVKEGIFLASFSYQLSVMEDDMFFEKSQSSFTVGDLRLKKLTRQQIEQIDELLGSLEDQGEVRLILQRGVLKYVNKVERYQVLDTDEQE